MKLFSPYVALTVLLCGAVGGRALVPPKEAPLADFDRRQLSSEGEAASPEQKAAAAALHARLPKVRVDFDRITGAPVMVSGLDELLTDAGGQGKTVSENSAKVFAEDDPYRAAKTFLREHRGLFGHGPEALEQAIVKREFVGAHNGLRTVVWEQQVDGVSIFEGVLVAHITKNGELVNLNSKFLREPTKAADLGLPNRAAILALPPIEAAEAVARAARNLGDEAHAEQLAARAGQPPSKDKLQKLTGPFLRGEAEARLTWLPMDPQTLRLCWDVILTGRKHREMFRVLVDAQSGEALLRHCLTAYISPATYNVFTSDSPSPFSPGYSTPSSGQPPLVSRTLVTLSALNTNASPNGWINDGGNETLGNNVDAHTDRNGDDLPDLPRPQGSPFRVFDFPMDLTTQPPTNYSQAAVVQLFYLCNWMHDKLYELGFTEAAGNFQSNNFGRGGLGNDAVQADAQDGSGIDNANFSTPPDGSPGRMQMFLWAMPFPPRDGDLDAEIVLHEYTHGLSNRRVGGGVGISALQAAGMGEGWSDFYAISLLSEAGDDVNGVYAAGAYCTYQLSGMTQNYYFGIRRYPYCTDTSKNPLTFKDIDPGQASLHTGIPRSSIVGTTADEIHNMGEVWCVTLWDARANLINRYGWAGGNQRMLQLVTDGMNLSPANPNFLQARDAILQADVVDYGGADRPQLWTAFAKRGMGVSATSPSSSTTAGLVEAYDVYDDLHCGPTTLSSSGPVGGPFTPNPASFTLLNAGTNALSWSLAGTGNWITVSPTNGTLAVGSTGTVSVLIGAVATNFPLGSTNSIIWFTNQTSGIAQTRTFTLSVVGRALFENFEPNVHLSLWSAFGGTLGSTVIATNYGGSISGVNSLWFGDAGTRSATTIPVNTSAGGTLSFYLRLGNGSFPWETVDIPSEGIVLEYSINNGASWTLMGTCDTSTFYSWTQVTTNIPAGALSAATQFRWRQLSHSGTCCDHWALDDISIDAGPTPPSIVSQPGNITVPVGGTAIFSLSVFGTAPLSYQWQFNGVPMAGATDSTLTLLNVQSNMAGLYNAVVTNAYGSVVSSNALLRVVPPGSGIAVFADPTYIDMTSGGVGAEGVNIQTTLTNRGYAVVPFINISSVAVAGATLLFPEQERLSVAPYLGIARQSLSNAVAQGALLIVVGGENGAASLLNTVFGFSTVESSQTSSGTPYSLTAQAAGTVFAGGPASVPVNDGTTTLTGLPVNALSIYQSGGQTAVALMSFGSGTIIFLGFDWYNAVPIGVQDGGWVNVLLEAVGPPAPAPPVIWGQPQSQTVGQGNTASLNVAVSGSTPLFYQWLFNDVALPGATFNPLVFPSVQFSNAGTYSVIVSNSLGTSISSNATLTVTFATLTNYMVNSGWYDSTGSHSSSNPNYIVGLLSGTGYRDFFVFNIPTLTQAVVSASLQLYTYGLLSPSGTEIYELRNVRTPVSTLIAGGIGLTDIFNDLADGTVYATWSVGSTSASQYVTIPLNDSALAAIAAASGQAFAFGGAITNLAASFDEYLFGGSSGLSTDGQLILMTGSAAPLITTQPASQTVRSGTNVTFTVTALGSFPLVYQWRKDGTNLSDGGRISGAATATLNILSVLESDNGQYWVVITNNSGSVTSSNATLLVTPLDHFEWAALSSPQAAGVPFGATITAKDFLNATVTNFNSTVSLSGSANGGQTTNTILGNPVYDSSGTGSATLGYSFTPNTNITVTHVRYYFGTKVSIWTDGGVLLTAQNVTSTPGTWMETELPTPIQLLASVTYRVAAYSGGGDYYAHTGLGGTFPDGTIDHGYQSSGDAFPVNFDSRSWLVDLRYTVNSGVPVVLSPTSIGPFTNGVWNGMLTVQAPAPNVILRADEAGGHSGLSNPFDVDLQNDLSIAIADSPNPVSVGESLIYTLAITNTGPADATGVMVTNALPANATFISAAVSQGTYTQSAGLVICDLGTVPGATNASVSIVVVPTISGSVLTNTATVSRAEPDAYLSNDVATTLTTVIPPAISVADAAVVEGNVGTTNLLFAVTLNVPSVQTITVNYSTANGTALAGSDYTATNGIVTFAPGSTNQNVVVRVFGDTLIEGNETLFVNFFNPANGVLARSQAVGTITNDDGLPGQIDHFSWQPISSPQVANLPFIATITALDASNAIVTNFTGPVNLSASSAPVIPTVSDPFSNGVWSGAIAVQAFATNLTLRADDGDGHFGLSNPFHVINSNQPPVVLASPTNIVAYLGGTAAFQANILGSAPLSYQWRLNGVNIAGATNSVLVLERVLVSQAGSYSVVASNAFGAVSSSKAVMTVLQLLAWGAGTNYLGTPNYGQSIVPAGLSGVVAAAGGTYHTLALKADGRVLAWGAGTNYLSSPNWGQSTVPASLTNAVAVAGGFYHSLALRADGTVLAWGAGTSNNISPHYGQSIVPAGLANVVAIAAGDYHSVALKGDGKVVVWGNNTYGQTIIPASATNVVAVASRGSHVLALRADGGLVHWGNPASLPFGLSNVIAIAAGANHCLALKNDGSVVSWGSLATVPAGLSNVVDVAAGYDYSLALKSDGTVSTWGTTNIYGIGRIPSGLSSGIAIGCGAYHSLAVLGDGTAFIKRHPANTSAYLGAAANFKVVAMGAQPLAYQWQVNGVDIPGATNSSLTLTNIQTADAGDYRVTVTNNYRAVTSSIAALAVLLPVGEALDNTNLVWGASGNAAWFGQTNVTYDHIDAAQSGLITHNQSSSISVVVGGAGTLNFSWKVSSEEYFDYLSFYIDGIKQAGISGEIDWQSQAYGLADGVHTLSWTYAKDSSVSVGADAGWVDQVVYFTNPPVIVLQPLSQTVSGGSTVVLSVAATGAPPLSYQWIKAGTNVPTATASTLNIISAARRDAGLYAAAVSNPGGTTLSTNALLLILVPQQLSGPILLPEGSFVLRSGDVDGGVINPSDLQNFEAQTSTNLVDWSALTGALTLTNGTLELIDALSGDSPSRFYRIIEHPKGN